MVVEHPNCEFVLYVKVFSCIKKENNFTVCPINKRIPSQLNGQINWRLSSHFGLIERLNVFFLGKVHNYCLSKPYSTFFKVHKDTSALKNTLYMFK